MLIRNRQVIEIVLLILFFFFVFIDIFKSPILSGVIVEAITLTILLFCFWLLYGVRKNRIFYIFGTILFLIINLFEFGLIWSYSHTILIYNLTTMIPIVILGIFCLDIDYKLFKGITTKSRL